MEARYFNFLNLYSIPVSDRVCDTRQAISFVVNLSQYTHIWFPRNNSAAGIDFMEKIKPENKTLWLLASAPTKEKIQKQPSI